MSLTPSRRALVTGGGAVALSAALPRSAAAARIPPDARPLTPANVDSLMGAVGGNWVLTPGDYGGLSFYGKKMYQPDGPPNVIYGQPGVNIDYWFFDSCHNITVRYITTRSGNGSQGGAGIGCSGSRNITFDHCRARGAGKSFSIRNTRNATLTWCKAELTSGDGFALLSNQTLLVEDCWADTLAGDFFDIFGCTDATVRRCLATNPQLSRDGHHPDSFQLSNDGPVRNNRVTLEYLNVDCENGEWTQGPGFCDGSDNVTIRYVAGFGLGDNGLQLSDCNNCEVHDAFLQGQKFGSRITIRGKSDTVSIHDTRATLGVVDSHLDGPNRNVVLRNNASIPYARNAGDRAAYLAFLAANPQIPTRAHWDDAGWV